MDGTGLLFKPLLGALPDSITATVVAYPTDRPLGYAELLPLAMAALPKDSEFAILAESFSGPLALMLAATNPAGLRGVVLCGTFVRSPLPRPLSWLAGWARPWWFGLKPRALARWLLLGRYCNDELRELFESALAQVKPSVLAARARAVVAANADDALRTCRVPILYLAANADRVVRPGSLQLIQRLCPQVAAITLSGPHLLLQAAPVDAAREIAAFVKRVSAR